MKSCRNNTVIEIIKTVEKAAKILIAGHVKPDGDAVASCLALGLSLKNAGYNVTVYLEEYNQRYNFIKGKELIKREIQQNDADLFLSLDCGNIDRLGKMEEVFLQTPTTIVIDHHLGNEGFGDINYINPSASSTCELVYDIISQMGTMDKDIAKSIYAGIVFDTGGFKHSSTTAKTFNTVEKLIGFDIHPSEIYHQVLCVKSMAETKIFAKALSRITFYENLPIAYTYVTLDDLKNAMAKHSDLDGIVDYVLDIEGVEVAVFAYEISEDPVETKVSFRSKKMNVNRISTELGGGGHACAAGCTIYDTVEKALICALEQIKGDL